MHKKDEDFSFVEEGKDNFRQRLQNLIGNRSVRAAAKDWGVPVSTLNNYIHKGTEPSFKIVCLISNKEQVSLNWLAYGAEDVSQPPQPQPQPQPQPDTPCTGGGAQTLIAIWESLEPEEKLHVSKQLGRKGAEVLTQLLDDDNLCLMKLTGEKREAALLLVEMEPERAREILSKMREHGGLAQPENHQVNPKRAGAA
ncbi:XRE family transcriptional regulator [Salmonella enterica]|nr:XRE family transcriptional regulator [Salmonella enterica]EKH7896219.1 XRE family transcriptional regulator [Salmonella enterica]ELT2700299.1 XRE family transcriptional regulator [Salmonella enterica]